MEVGPDRVLPSGVGWKASVAQQIADQTTLMEFGY